MDDKAEKIALFRYGLIAPLVLETLPRGELTRRAQELAGRLYDIPHSTRRQVSVDTLLDWTLRYRRNGLAALSPKPRQDRGQARAVAPDTAALIERLKRENPHRTGAALLRELAVANEPNQTGLSASTLYRFLRARGLTERQLLLDKATAHKKYEAQLANQIWQSDMLFGPWVERPGGGEMQVFLQAALDDASRLVPHAQFYPNQGLDAFLDCLRQAIAARGIPTRLYSWPASPPPSAFSSCTRLRISLRAAARSNASSVPCANSFWPRSIQRFCSPSSNSTSAYGTGSTPSITAMSTALCKPRRCCVGSAISNRSASFRQPPICGVSSFIAWTGWCAAIPPSC
jgi:transposase